ncbi:hypothetical protein QTH65_01125 [Clostridium perfringens]|nr:hypothetical protein [Clostridium perfringens]
MQGDNREFLEYDKVKIGSRILSNESLDKLIPANKDIDNQLLAIRKIASNRKSSKINKKNIEFWDREFDRHYNNIFSVLGGRGSGKTSVLLTLKHQIMENYCNQDIILPLIVPEKIENSGNILECIIGLLGDIVDELEGYGYDTMMDSEPYKSCIKNKDNKLRDVYNELIKQFTYTQNDDYKNILINQYEGFNDYIENIRNTLDSDQKLIVDFEKFIEILIEEKRKICENDIEPMIFIFFDDVDLSAIKCIEVLNIILRYLSHPNIVVFVAGDYKTFSEVITINSLYKDNLLNEQMNVDFLGNTDSNKISALERRKIMTEDFLKKILPPAFRYYMPIMNEEQKAEFKFSTEEENESNIVGDRINKYLTLYELIKEIFIEDKNFLVYENNKIIYAYFKIFDETQRGTMNVYYFLNSMRNYKFEEVNEERERCLRIERFLNAIVRSSSILSKYENDINKIIIIKDNFDDIFIDYKYIENMLHRKDIEFDDLITLFILANFIENILVSENKKINPNSKRGIHGAEVLYNLLNSRNLNFNIYPRTKNVYLLLQMYTLISSKISNSNIKTLSDNGGKNYFLGKYFEVLDEIISGEDKQDFFRKLYLTDPIWVDDKIRIIMRYGIGDIILLINNVKYIYNKVHKLGIDKENLTHLKKNVNELIKECFKRENYMDYLKNNINRITQESNSIEENQIGFFEIKNNENLVLENHYEYLLEVYEDKMLFYEKEFEGEKSIYIIQEKVRKKMKELLDSLYEMYSENKSKRSMRNLEILESINIGDKPYLLEKEYQYMKEKIDMLNPMNFLEERSFIELKSLFGYIEYSDLKISKESSKNMEKIINKFFIDCINYIKIKTLIDFKTKEDEERGNNYIIKESFYERFNRLRVQIKSSKKNKNMIGFNKHIEQLEKESIKVNLNV